MRRLPWITCCLLFVASCQRQASDKSVIAAGQSRDSAHVSAPVLADSDPIDPETGLERSCDFSKVYANPSPDTLLREHLRRDGAAELTSSVPWIDSSIDCPGHLPGPDVYTLIAAYSIDRLSVLGDSALASVTFKQIGKVYSDSTFEADTATKTEQVILVRTKYGWRIRNDTYPWLDILLAHAINMKEKDKAIATRLAHAMVGSGA
jgi:hypothetical protein